MESIEQTGNTVEEAITAALEALGATRDQVEIEVLQEDSKGLLGIIGQAEAKVRVSLKPTASNRAVEALSEIFRYMNVPAEAQVVREDEETVEVEIESPEDLGILIGKHGQTLFALQQLVNLMANKGQLVWKRIILDAQGYRHRREKTLQDLALSTAQKVKELGKEVVLDALLAYERRIIHITLEDDPSVTTRSIGEEPNRKVVIEPQLQP